MAPQLNLKTESLEKIIESLQCYECKAVPGPNGEHRNRFRCVDNLHPLCETCKTKCKCGSLVGICPCPTIHQILEELPWFCPHYKTGCRETYVKAEDIDEHQKNCIFRMIYCPSNISPNGCKEKILFKNISNHLEACTFKIEYGFPTIETENNKCTIHLHTITKDNQRIGAWKPKEFKSIDGMTFYLVGHWSKNKDYVHFWIYFLGSPQEAKNYAYTLSTGKPGDKFTYQGHVKPLDEGCHDIIAKQSGFAIGIEAMKRLEDKNNQLAVEVTFHDLKEEAKDTDMESGVSADESEFNFVKIINTIIKTYRYLFLCTRLGTYHKYFFITIHQGL